MTPTEIFVEELAAVYDSGPIAKVDLASVVPQATERSCTVVCRLVGTTSDMRRIAAALLQALGPETEAPPQAEAEPQRDEVVIATVS
jgi:hypothetical protein